MNSKEFPLDIKQRVDRLLSACGGKSLGSYTESQGISTIRQDIANYIQQRDGYPSDPNDIYLCNGASDGIKTVMKLLMNNNLKKPSGIVCSIMFELNFQTLVVIFIQMIPVPQYPLYSATISEYGAFPIEYFLDEDHNWALNIDELERSLATSKESCVPRGIVVINPGNPTG